MLVNLHIQNLAIIDVIDIDFKQGLTVITGETGAGKSLIIDAIELLTGGRSSSSIVRTNAAKAVIEGTFANVDKRIYQMLQEADIMIEDDLIVLRRDIYANGKSVFRVNGESISLSLAETLCNHLVDIHVQNDNLRLFNPKNYLSFVDNAEIKALLDEYRLGLNEYLSLIKKRNDLINKKDQINQNLDFLMFQLDELTNAKLKVGELEALEEELTILNNYENIFQFLTNIKTLIDENNITENLYSILDWIKKLKVLNPKYLDYNEQIESAYYNVLDLGETINDELMHLEFDQNRFNEINERIGEIKRLCKKYHLEVSELIDKQKTLKTEIDNIENYDVYLEDLDNEVRKSFEQLKKLAFDISNQRIAQARLLKENILSTLSDLMLDKVKLDFVFVQNEIESYLDYQKFTKNGIDNLEIMISFNPGEALKPLAKVASGGETSRVMLAIKMHLFVNSGVSTVIFDEIDTGVSGAVASSVAKKLKLMSENIQVFSITHLPLVASVADQHLNVTKISEQESTTTIVKELSFNERIDVLASMIDPNDQSGKTKEVAKAMLTK